jgi:UDP-N-acetylglucosamine--N-acetylmuramyl-(pentapeptide) pyrophosphoryl-undecaprenol N-acetylglucosamine transferase
VAVTFAGSPERVEARLVPEAGFELDTFAIGGLPRRPSLALARGLGRAAGAPLVCRRILERRRPHVVLGGGGFVAGPMVLAAWTKRIPSALMEADAHLGLANRLSAPFTRLVFLAYAVPGRSGPKYEVVGRPIPERSRPQPRPEARAMFGLPAEGPVLAVFGSIAGARPLNELALRAFGASGPGVLHLAGERDFEQLGGSAMRADYVLLPSTDRFGAAVSAADLVLSRSGGSVWEIAAAGRPAILVPYPHATGDHQTRNARHFEAAGGAVCVPESELDQVPELVRTLLADPERLRRMGEAMREAARPDAATAVADGVIRLARERTGDANDPEGSMP